MHVQWWPRARPGGEEGDVWSCGFPITPWRHPEMPREERSKRAHALEPAPPRHLGHIRAAAPQQRGGALEAQPRHGAVGRLSECGGEEAVEVKGRKACVACDF